MLHRQLKNGQKIPVFQKPYLLSQIRVPKNSIVFQFVIKFWSKLTGIVNIVKDDYVS